MAWQAVQLVSATDSATDGFFTVILLHHGQRGTRDLESIPLRENSSEVFCMEPHKIYFNFLREFRKDYFVFRAFV